MILTELDVMNELCTGEPGPGDVILLAREIVRLRALLLESKGLLEKKSDKGLGFHENMTYEEYEQAMLRAYKYGIIACKQHADDKDNMLNDIKFIQKITRELNII